VEIGNVAFASFSLYSILGTQNFTIRMRIFDSTFFFFAFDVHSMKLPPKKHLKKLVQWARGFYDRGTLTTTFSVKKWTFSN
jgi:hypothetical protein